MYKVAGQEVSLSIIIGSWSAIIDIAAPVNWATRREGHDTHIERENLVSLHSTYEV